MKFAQTLINAIGEKSFTEQVEFLAQDYKGLGEGAARARAAIETYESDHERDASYARKAAQNLYAASAGHFNNKQDTLDAWKMAWNIGLNAHNPPKMSGVKPDTKALIKALKNRRLETGHDKHTLTKKLQGYRKGMGTKEASKTIRELFK